MLAFEVKVNLMLKIYQHLQCIWGAYFTKIYNYQEAENSTVLDKANLNVMAV